MIRNLNVDDLALCELLEGGTAAPPQVLGRLQGKGLVTILGGTIRLTAKGRARAQRIARQPGLTSDLRLLGSAKAEGRAALTTDSQASLHVAGGGPARINS
jgi:hypothetical protein